MKTQMAFNNEIEEVKAQLKVLEKKLSFLEELSQTKTPAEIAYKRVYGKYPVKEVSENLTAEDNWNVISWSSFQDGYIASQKDYKVGEYQETAQERGERVHNEMEETIRIHDGYGVVDYKPTPKTPVEECYKDWWGEYPGDENWTSDATRWQGFQAGYEFAYQEKIMEKVQEEQKWDAVRESVRWCEENPDKDPLDWLKPQTPEQVADGLKEAFREAVKNGIIPEVDKLSDDFMDKMVAKLKGKTLMDLIYDWWEDIFTKNSDLDMENCIGRLVYWIEEWLPKEQSAAGSQSVGVEDMVEGFNDCLNKIKRKLR